MRALVDAMNYELCVKVCLTRAHITAIQLILIYYNRIDKRRRTSWIKDMEI